MIRAFLRKPEKSCLQVLIDWKDVVHDRVTVDKQLSDLLQHSTIIIRMVLWLMGDTSGVTHVSVLSPGYLNYEADIGAPPTTDISLRRGFHLKAVLMSLCANISFTFQATSNPSI